MNSIIIKSIIMRTLTEDYKHQAVISSRIKLNVHEINFKTSNLTFELHIDNIVE